MHEEFSPYAAYAVTSSLLSFGCSQPWSQGTVPQSCPGVFHGPYSVAWCTQ